MTIKKMKLFNNIKVLSSLTKAETITNQIIIYDASNKKVIPIYK